MKDFYELIVDNFAGGGGASTGIFLGLNRHPDIAVNHAADALHLHKVNHPKTRHLCEDVFAVDPIEVTYGQPVGLAWFSPDCKHFSKAKGGKPRNKKIRGLAWVAVKWAATVRPRVIILENVEEFKDWGPLLDNGQPCKRRKGQTFRNFVARLKNLGYEVAHRELRACDYGAPTIRKRFFLIARCDGKPIVWPEPSHGPGRPLPYRTAAECIDWSLPCASIFDRKRPLAEATMRRIARGLRKFVINAKEPFIVTCNHQGEHFRGQGLREPFKTIAGAHDAHGLVVPYLTECANASNQRVLDASEPLRTQCSEVKGGHFALVSAFMAKFRINSTGTAANAPLHTVTAGGDPVRPSTGNVHGLVTAHLMRQFGQSDAADAGFPMPTVVAGGGGKTALVTSHICKLRGDNVGHRTDEPLQTISAGGAHFAEVRAFLMKYYGTGGQDADLTEPMHTVTSVDRLALVTISGVDYVITDISMRMLEPHELYAAQGFPSDYIIAPEWNGKRLSKRAQVRMCGNSVCPPLAAALVRANVPEMAHYSTAEAPLTRPECIGVQ